MCASQAYVQTLLLWLRMGACLLPAVRFTTSPRQGNAKKEITMEIVFAEFRTNGFGVLPFLLGPPSRTTLGLN